ncbi:hypothetical protein K466DRAFT_178443 [Polyporus arcularius HHB13444]|uniref:Uncharacterized protein n=1 Tax=Polyporus arcularius HHB13444 TaxID=1314778 RepID=A0A5C3PC15_9APHY|nr:hypothetical protein K466DRAFT_178443 [Polyporus arcularius HHB13444]
MLTVTITITIYTSPTIAQSDLAFIAMLSNITQCVPITVSWSGGIPPFDLALVCPGIATPLQLYTGLADDSFQWSANISAGTTVSFQLEDAEGEMVVSQAALTIAPGPDFCLPTSVTSTSTTSQSTASPSGHSTTTASPTPTVFESVKKPNDLGAASYSGIAIGGTFALVGAVVLLVMVRRRCRRRVSRYPRDLVDLNESPRPTGAATPPWRDGSIRQRPPTIYMPSSRKLSQLFESHSPTSPDAIPLHEIVGQQYVPGLTEPSRAFRPGPSGPPSKRSNLERRGAIRSEHISRPLPMPPGLGPVETSSEPTSPVLQQYADATRGPRQELDGGVRLAGGPPEEDWDRLSDILPTVPPPYRRYTK